MVAVGDGSHSRELCGGTHVRSTAEIGLLKITAETSSAANVRRIEAFTGPAAVGLLREHDRWLTEISQTLRTRPQDTAAAVNQRELERKTLEKALAGAARENGSVDPADLAARAQQLGEAWILAEAVEVPGANELLELTDRVKGKLKDAAIVLGSVADGRVHLVVSVAPALVQRGLRAGELVKVAAAVIGGGGGGRDTMAQAGGRYPEKLAEALQVAREAIDSVLAA